MSNNQWRFTKNQNANAPKFDTSAFNFVSDGRYQSDYRSKLKPSEMEQRMKQVEAERQGQLGNFQKTWTDQMQQPQQKDGWFRAGQWAPVPEAEIEGVLLYPIHAKEWEGEQYFIENLLIAQGFLDTTSSKMHYQGEIKCQVCGAELDNFEYVDQTNKVSWPASAIHYFGDHHNPPTQPFFDYCEGVANALQGRM